MGGKTSGGGDGGAAERERQRKERVSKSIRAINELFFQRKPPTPIPPQEMGRVQIGEAYAPGTEGDDMSLPQPVYGTGVVNQAEIDRINAENEKRGFLPDYTPERQQALDDVQEKVRQRFMPEFERDTANAQRELKFALARRGLSQSSAQADASSRLRQRVADTERDIAQKALVARTEAERGQQALMDNLIAQAQADTEQSVLLNQATSGQNAAINRAVENAKAQALPNAFQDVGTLFKDIVERRNFNQGLRAGLTGTGFRTSTPSSLFGSGSSNSGVETAS
jgi:hypothetical protein